jgi:hypothetical protein
MKQSLKNLEPISIPSSQVKPRTKLSALIRTAKPAELMDSLMYVSGSQGRTPLSPAIALPPSFGRKVGSSISSNKRDQEPKKRLDLGSYFGRIAGLSPIKSEEKKSDSCVKRLDEYDSEELLTDAVAQSCPRSKAWDFEACEAVAELTRPVFKERAQSEERAKTPVVRLAVKFNHRPEAKTRKIEVRDYGGLSRFCV